MNMDVTNGTLSLDWLRPFIPSRHLKNGDILFSKGEPADSMALILSGRFRILALSLDLGLGQIVGEMGLMPPVRRRTQTVACLEPGEILEIDPARLRHLYFHNPAFGFVLFELTTQLLFDNIVLLEQRLSARSASVEREKNIPGGPDQFRERVLDVHVNLLERALEVERAISGL